MPDIMHLRHLAWFAIFGLALVQAEKSTFEPADFDVAAALGSYGVDVPVIESSGGSEAWSIETGCRTAVRMNSTIAGAISHLSMMHAYTHSMAASTDYRSVEL